ncbi:flagellar basal body rod protein FlgB [Megalodesulfovibrio paquesii]
MRSLFPLHAELVGKVMDMRMERQNVVMANLANLRTPGYKSMTLEFEEDLQAALNRDPKGKLARTSGEHLARKFDPNTFQDTYVKEFQPHVVHGGDRVDLDKEMAVMSKNNMMYNALATVLKKHFEGMKTVIQEGSK